MKIALFPNFGKYGASDLLDKVISSLKSFGGSCFVPEGVTADCGLLDEESLYRDCDVIISIGGDGTLIKCAKKAATYDKPCLGINAGRLGFLANLEADQTDLLSGLLKGDFQIEERMLLSVKAEKNGETVFEDIALNDAVISSGQVARITDITLDVSGDTIEYLADGVIISTPTGSTAYSMSAGGPIIDPGVRCLTVTPICSHSLTARPMIASESAVMKIRLMDTSRTRAFLTVDGQRCGEVDFETVVTVKKAPITAKLINLSGATIYKNISRKF